MQDGVWSVLFVLGWLIIFTLLYFASVPLLQAVLCLGGEEYTESRKALTTLSSDPDKKAKLNNLRRLLRSQLYCIGSSITGIYLLVVEYNDLPNDFFIQWGTLQQIAFSGAVAHWILSLVEDNLAGDEIISQVSLATANSSSLTTSMQGDMISEKRRKEISASQNQRDGMFCFIYFGLLSHHLCALFPFCWTLVTHELAGICLFGLLIEIPVLFLNIRDVLVSFEGELFKVHQWSKVKVVRFWWVFQFFWHCTRSVSCVLYFVSLFIWSSSIHSLLLPSSRVVYHILGALFNYINITLLCTVIPLYLFEDLRRCDEDPNKYMKNKAIIPFTESGL